MGIVLAKILSPLLIGGLKKYRAIEARTVASAMVAIARLDDKGIHRYESDEIQRIASLRQVSLR